MLTYDKHDYSTRVILYELMKDLRPEGLGRPFRALDIGCGFGLRFTGELLHGLATRGVFSPALHLVDPSLYGWTTHFALGALKKDFPRASFGLHARVWDSTIFGPRGARFAAAFAIQATTLFDPGAFDRLHRDLARLLVRGGYFADVSELRDRVTDPLLYADTRVYSRSDVQRERVAARHGFELVKKIVMNAHAAEDGQKMCGTLFRRML